MTKLYEQQQLRHNPRLSSRGKQHSSSDDESLTTSASAERNDSVTSPETAEVVRLKRQLELTTERMAQMDMEINQFRLAQHTVEHAIGSPYPSAPELAFRPNAGDREILNKQYTVPPAHHLHKSHIQPFDIPVAAPNTVLQNQFHIPLVQSFKSIIVAD